MSNVSLGKLNVPVPSRDRITRSLELIDVQINTPTFGDHLQRATTPPEDADPRRPARNANVSDRTPAEVESEETDGAATSESSQDVETEEGSPNTAVTRKIAEEQVVDEVAEEEIDEEAASRRASDGSSKQSTKQLPQPTTPGEAGSAEGANANTKAVATDQLSVDPSDATAREDDGDSSTSDNGSADGETRKRPAGDAVPTDPNGKDRGVTATPSPNATKSAEVNQGAASLQGGDDDAEGKRESEPRTGRHTRRAKHTQSSQSNTPSTAPAEQAAAGPTSLEKSPVVVEVERNRSRVGDPRKRAYAAMARPLSRIFGQPG